MIRFITHTWLVLTILGVGCATPPPPPGVRDAFRDSRITSIAVAPAYALDTMGLSAFEHEVLAAAVARAATLWLVEQGVAVTEPVALEVNLRSNGAWQDFYDAWYRGVPLRTAFEAAPAGFRGIEIQTAQHIAKVVDANAFLVIQVLYQGDVDCSPDQVRDETPYAVVSTSGDECVVTHLEGKLIDAASGLTVWHNVAYVEMAGRWTSQTRSAAIAAATRWLLGSSHGISTLLRLERQPSDTSNR